MARVGLIGLLALTAFTYGALDKAIDLRIEGRVSHVHTFALTVRDVLARSHVKLGPGDWVEPPLSSRLAEGQVVEVRRAKDVTIMLNGQPTRVVTTALNVQQLLADLKLRGSMRDFVSASRASRVGTGMTLVYREAVGIRVRADGVTRTVITNAPSVGGVLTELGVKLGSRDIIEPDPATYPTQDLLVRVLRVGDHIESAEQSIEYPTIYRRILNLEYGTRKPVQEGRSGIRLMKYRSTYVDGRRTARRLLSSDVVRKPVPRIVGVGAGFPGCVCRRGSSNGKATWYDAPGLTAAHPWLPFGTVVRVENPANGKYVNVVIRDRGPYGPGRIIDLSDNAFARIAPLGKGIVYVRIRW